MTEWRFVISTLVVVAVVIYAMYKPEEWHKFLDSLATDGGYMVCLFILLLIGWRMFQSDATAGGSIMTLSSGAILNQQRNKKKNGDPVIDPNVDSTGDTK
jgi:hypothetical protein